MDEKVERASFDVAVLSLEDRNCWRKGFDLRDRAGEGIVVLVVGECTIPDRVGC